MTSSAAVAMAESLDKVRETSWVKIAIATIAMRISLDPYITDTLMRDLLGHDRAPSAFAFYLWLWRHTRGIGKTAIGVSLQHIASETGLSKSSVQNAIRRLRRRKLISVRRDGATTACHYEVLEPWRGR